MNEFKVGDKVRCVKSRASAKINDEFVITGLHVPGFIKCERVSDKQDFLFGCENAHEYLELVKPINEFEFITLIPNVGGQLTITFLNENVMTHNSNEDLFEDKDLSRYKIIVEKLDD